MALIERIDAGALIISGSDRYSWLQGMVSQDVRPLETAGGRVSALVLDSTGHILSDMALIDVRGATRLANLLGAPEPDFVLVDLPAANAPNIAALFDRFVVVEDVVVEDVTDRIA